MILHALKGYYDRKAADPESDIAPLGFEKKEIPFLIAIKPNGEFVHIEDTREQNGKKLKARTFILPRSKGRSGQKSYETTFLLWDHIGYLFGYPKEDVKAANQHKTWINMLKTLPSPLKEDKGVRAILSFYETNQISKVFTDSYWPECLKVLSCNMTFKLIGESFPIPCSKIIHEFIRTNQTNYDTENSSEGDSDSKKVYGNCLVTGEYGEIARTHSRTPINKDTKSFISFQKSSGFDSYGKEQGYNAPIITPTEFAYSTGLNTLLKSSQKVQIGDTTIVFWSEKKNVFETDVPLFFSEPPKDNPDQNTEFVKATYDSIWSGAYNVPNDNLCFYILGLSPNSARISVRLWEVSTIKEIGKRLAQHVDDLSVVHGNLNPALPLWTLLRSIATQEDSKNIPPNLAGDTVRAILEGLPYPATLLQAAIRRNRAEQNVTYPRTALIKACLNRQLKYHNPYHERMITMSLDLENDNIGYRLGRLFAALEKIQKESFTQNGGKEPNSTIRDRFYGAASGTPRTVFGNLMRLKNHHLSKMENPGRKIYFEKLLSQIIDGITDFPGHLNIADQGRFAIGYYHQVQEFYN